MFVESKAGFVLNKPPFYFLPWSVPGDDGRIAEKALQIEQGNVKKLIANKIDLTLFPPKIDIPLIEPWQCTQDFW